MVELERIYKCTKQKVPKEKHLMSFISITNVKENVKMNNVKGKIEKSDSLVVSHNSIS